MASTEDTQTIARRPILFRNALYRLRKMLLKF